MKVKSIAVIGAGFIGTVHIEAIRRMGFQVKGILTGSTESASLAKQKLKIEHAYASVKEICEDRDVSVVHVTSPNALHFEQVSALIKAGKHVVCEKPLAVSTAEGEELLALAQKHDIKHALCFNTRFYPLVHEARIRILHGDIGEIKYINAHYHQDWLLLASDWNWRLDPALGGGLRAVADIGSHLIDNLSFVTGLEVAEVFSDLHTFVKVRKKPMGSVETFSSSHGGDTVDVSMTTDDAAGILVRYTNGARATLSISQVSGGQKNSLQWEIAGSKASFAFDAMSPEILWIGHRGQPNETLQKESSLLSPEARRTAFYPAGHIEGFGETFRSLFEAFYDDLENDTSSGAYPDFADGITSLKVTSAIAESTRTNNWVSAN